MRTDTALLTIVQTARIRRVPFLVAGVVLAAIKFAIDQAVTHAFRGESWSPWNYLVWPLDATAQDLLGGASDPAYPLLMGAIAVIFASVGLVLTAARLRDSGLSGLCALLFLVPIANLAIIMLACIAPSHESAATLNARTDAPAEFPVDVPEVRSSAAPPRQVAAHPAQSPPTPGRATGVLAVASLAGALAMLGGGALAIAITTFGLAVFFLAPALGGLVACVLTGADGAGTPGRGLLASCLSLAWFGGFVVLFALDGAVCVMLAMPLMIPLALIGGMFGLPMQRFVRDAMRAKLPPSVGVLLLVGGAAISAAATLLERAVRDAPPIRSVVTEVIVDAPADVVWTQVVAFPPIAPPTEWLFRLGIAYPTHATIVPRRDDDRPDASLDDQLGVGAVRECVFSTGAFIEPITVWDPPHQLAFDVIAQPAPMRELSPYEIHPDHLDSHLTSHRGEFRLETLPDGRTRLVGTTWYEVRMWPQAWWGNVSDAIIHRIHRRVLEHVRDTAEGGDRSEPWGGD